MIAFMDGARQQRFRLAPRQLVLPYYDINLFYLTWRDGSGKLKLLIEENQFPEMINGIYTT